MFTPDFSREKILDDLARAAGETAGMVSNLNRKIRTEVKVYMDDLATRLDLVPREDFERLEEMVKTLRQEQESLKEKLESLSKDT